MQLEEKQDVFRSLQDTAELLSLENHPAKQTVEVCDLRMCEGQVLRVVIIEASNSETLFC